VLAAERLARLTIPSSARQKELVQRIRAVVTELDAERQRRSALAYDQQALLAKMIRLETEIILLQAETSRPD
jgi:hypothetical protein